jgi:hypothetical protein
LLLVNDKIMFKLLSGELEQGSRLGSNDPYRTGSWIQIRIPTLDPDSDPGDKSTANPRRNGSVTLPYTVHFTTATGNWLNRCDQLRKMALHTVIFPIQLHDTTVPHLDRSAWRDSAPLGEQFDFTVPVDSTCTDMEDFLLSAAKSRTTVQRVQPQEKQCFWYNFSCYYDRIVERRCSATFGQSQSIFASDGTTGFTLPWTWCPVKIRRRNIQRFSSSQVRNNYPWSETPPPPYK